MDANNTEETTTTKPESKLNPREEELFKLAMMYCLKSGRPQVDYEKFKEFGKFNTLKTAQNTWSKIKGKLPVLESEEAGDGDEDAAKATPKTPKSAKGTPKKRAAAVKKEDGDEAEEAEGSPAKKSKKATPKKKAVAAADEEDVPVKAEEGEAE